MKKIFLTLVFILCFVTSAYPQAGTSWFYVRSTDGDDADNGSTWALAKATLKGVFDDADCTAGDLIYVSEDHAESTAGAVTLTSPGTAADPVRIICVDDDDADDPPTPTMTTATVTVSTTNALAFNGFAYCYGVQFVGGGIIQLQTTSSAFVGWTFESDGSNVFKLTADSTSYYVYLYAGTSAAVYCKIINGDIEFKHVGQDIQVGYNADFEWIGGTFSMTDDEGCTALFGTNSVANPKILVRGVDLSAVGKDATATSLVNVDTNSGMYNYVFANCILPADAGFTYTSGTWDAPYKGMLRFSACSVADNDAANIDFYQNSYEGTVQEDTGVYRDSGAATPGATSFSWKMVPSANTRFTGVNLVSPPITKWLTDEGSQTYYIDCAITAVVGSIDTDQLWVEFEYPANATDGLSTIVTSRCSDLISGCTTDCTTSTATWTGVAEAAIKLPCTFDPGKSGPVTARVYLTDGATSVITVYVDPVIRKQ